jgi:hypothetical protein
MPEYTITGYPKSGLGHEPERRQDEDVHLRMPEQPEQVLPEQWISAGLDLVEVRAEEAVEHEERQRDGEDREGEHDHELRDERHPREDRHAHEVHAGRAHVDDGGDEVESGSQRREAENLEAEHPEIDVEAG